jgi:predicted MFS family arabinose efflux permease
MPTTNTKRWAVPLVCVLLGLAFLAVFWISGNPGAGLGSLAVMVGYGLLLLVGGRSEIVRTLRGQAPDERYGMFDLRATAITGTVTLSVLVGATLYELARGQDPSPYVTIIAIAAVTYLAALLWLRWRS